MAKSNIDDKEVVGDKHNRDWGEENYLDDGDFIDNSDFIDDDEYAVGLQLEG